MLCASVNCQCKNSQMSGFLLLHSFLSGSFLVTYKERVEDTLNKIQFCKLSWKGGSQLKRYH